MNTFCSYFNAGICRSCDLIELNDQDQLRAKEKTLLNSLAMFKGSLEPTFYSDQQGFRNKMKMVVTGTIDAPIIGLQGEEHLDLGREILACPVHHPVLNKLIASIVAFITLAKLTPYSISTKKGELKGIIAFVSPETNEVYLRFILRSEEAITRITKFLSTLVADVPELKVISANIQPVPHAILEGEKEIFLTKNTFLNHRLNHLELQLGPQGFVQTNQKVATALYQEAALWVKESGVENFAELFCGQGAFSFFCAPYINQGLGIEINVDAVKVANETAKKSGLHHLIFKAADAASVKTELNTFHPDMILVNPPRRGLTEAVNLFNEIRPAYIIYSSCNHETLGKDIVSLTGYRVIKVKLFDMFPHTSHFETLVLLQRL